MDMPLIARQLERWRQQVTRVLLNSTGAESSCAICLGPPGISKSYSVRSTASVCHVPLIPVPPATTLYGFVAMLRRDPYAVFWLDENDDWVTDPDFINMLKKALETSGPRSIGAVTNNTLRRGIEPFEFYGRIIITSNVDLKSISAKLAPHVKAIGDRTEFCEISWSPRDRLAYIDYLVAEMDYFRSPVYLQDQKMAHRQLSREQVIDVLQFMHENAFRIEPTLRRLNAIARERVSDPVHWYENMLISAPDPIPWSTPVPPMPEILSSVERAGRVSNAPRGKKAKRAALMAVKWTTKREAQDHVVSGTTVCRAAEQMIAGAADGHQKGVMAG